MLRVLISILVAGAVLLVFAGFAQAIHPAADSLSLLRPVAGTVSVLGVFVFRRTALRVLAGLAVVMAAITIVPTFLSGSADGTLRIYSKNLWFGNEAFAAVADDIMALDVDVVMLQEVSTRNDRILDLLVSEFPHQHLCRFSDWSGIAVVSRVPFTQAGRCSELRALAAAQIMHEGAVVWVVSAHIHWPWPANTVPHEEAALRLLAGLDGPVVVAGDFNIFAWSRRVQGIVAQTGGVLAGPSLPTLRFHGVPLMIDHVIAPGGGVVTRRPLFGGDHRGLLADVRVTP